MPGSNARALEKAATLPADGLILDLEDSVAPEAKAAARDLVTRAAGADRAAFGAREVIVRVNGLDTPWGHDDVVAAARLKADAILFPKISTPEDVMAAIRALEAAGAPETLPLWIMAETPRCILEIDRIAGSHPRLACIVAGTSDLTRDLRARHVVNRLNVFTALSLIVLAARSHGLDAIDGVFLDLADEAGLAAACEQGRDMGFDGKTLIHPRQLAAANSAFAPNAEELETAAKVVAAWAEARALGKGVCVVDGKLIEKLHVEEFERMIALDRAIRAAAAAAADAA
jgi:citrate lyase subunit beta/citryl-CoA lyase